MERTDKIMTQEEVEQIRAEIMRLEMEQHFEGKNNSKKIKELKDKIS